MDLKKQNHWRARPDYEKRFTYSGFLRCGKCGNRVYTHGRQGRDWYVCKSRTAESRNLERCGMADCTNPIYATRTKLKQCIDRLFTEKVTRRDFSRATGGRICASYEAQYTETQDPTAAHRNSNN